MKEITNWKYKLSNKINKKIIYKLIQIHIII